MTLRVRGASSVTVCVAAAALSYPVDAFAYIDPSAGGFLFQMLAPIVAISLSALLFVRDRVKRAIIQLFKLLRK